MWISALLLISASFLGWLEIPNTLLQLSEHLHQYCLDFTQVRSFTPELSQSLICGRSIYKHASQDVIKSAGIIHYFVVSGAHILLIESLFKKLPASAKLRKYSFSIFMVIYCAICQFKAPVLRSFLYFCISNFNKKFHLNLRHIDQQILAFSFCLALVPSFWTTVSLPLSCATSSALHFPIGKVQKLLLIYMIIIFYTLPFGAPYPISIIVNLIFSPIFAFVLFPLTWLSLLLPFLREPQKMLWDTSFGLLKNFQLQLLPQSQPHSLSIMWSFLLFLFLCLILFHFKKTLEVCRLS